MGQTLQHTHTSVKYNWPRIPLGQEEVSLGKANSPLLWIPSPLSLSSCPPTSVTSPLASLSSEPSLPGPTASEDLM